MCRMGCPEFIVFLGILKYLKCENIRNTTICSVSIRIIVLQFVFLNNLHFVLKDSDLRSALLLEQAAHCYINMEVPKVRKYSFHMILAGHRFSKAGQVCIHVYNATF